MESHEQKIEVTPEDIAQLCAMNPLAAEQLKNFALQRRLLELQQLVGLQSNGTGDEEMPVETAVAKKPGD